MNYKINKVGVIGAGTMGGGIAALIAGTGVSVVLLDVPADDVDRNKTVKALWERQRKSSPAALFTPEAANLVTLGNTEDDFDKLRECDWIIEVIIEQLEPKQQLMARIEGVRKPSAIVSSNTSGIPISSIGAKCGDAFRKHFLGTHFFNPPRYLKLLEVIPTADTALEVTAFIKDSGTNHLGKGVVICKDTPGFIANRIGAFVNQVRMLAAIENDYSVEEVDAITGVLIGNPKTATFRLADLVGLDVIWNLNRNQHAALLNDESRELFTSSEILNKLVAQKALGNKTGAGFYKTVQTAASREFFPLNLKTGQYEPPTKPRSALYGEVKDIEDIGQRIKEIFKRTDDRDAIYLIETTLKILAYAARCAPGICDSIAEIDNAMKWGFNSALGPFEMWDALGVREGVAMMREREIARNRAVDVAGAAARELTNAARIAEEMKTRAAEIARDAEIRSREIEKQEAIEAAEISSRRLVDSQRIEKEAETTVEKIARDQKIRNLEIARNKALDTAQIAAEEAVEAARVAKAKMVDAERILAEQDLDARKLERRKVLEQLEIARVQVLREAEIASQEEIERARIASERGLDDARIGHQTERRKLEIARERAIDEANMEKAIALYQKSLEESAAAVEAENARARAVEAAERATTAGEAEIASRAKVVGVTAAELDAERTRIAAEAEKIRKAVEAEAQRLIYEAETCSPTVPGWGFSSASFWTAWKASSPLRPSRWKRSTRSRSCSLAGPAPRGWTGRTGTAEVAAAAHRSARPTR
ncbi:MAG: hypothetical protein HC844_17915 [Tabrizicola sp.]|nr:hypothetical protein [Tabrizicola sp.]